MLRAGPGWFARSAAEAEYPELWSKIAGAWSARISHSGGTVLKDISGYGNHGTLTNMDAATDWVVTGGEPAIDFDGSNDLVATGKQILANSESQFSMTLWARGTLNGSANVAFNIGAAGILTYGLVLHNSSTGKWQFTVDGFTASAISDAAPTANKWHFLCGTYDASRNPKTIIFMDGKQCATTNNNSATTLSSAITSIGARDNGTLPFLGHIAEALLYREALSAEKVSLLYRLGPGGFATPARRLKAFSPAAPAASYTLTASAGSFALSGQAAGLYAGRRISAAAGSYAVSGQTASLLYGRRVGGDAGSCSLDGQAAGLYVGRSVSGGAGSYALSGQSAGLYCNRLASGGAGAFVVTGQSAGVRCGRRVGGEAAAYALSGQDASLLYSRTLAAGACSLSGQDAGLYCGRLVAGAAGAFAFSGQSAGLLVGRRVGGDAGAFALSGQAASLLAQRLINAAVGTFTLTGQSVEFSLGSNLPFNGPGLQFRVPKQSLQFRVPELAPLQFRVPKQGVQFRVPEPNP